MTQLPRPALLFDLDGTLAVTDPTHEEAWRQILDEYGQQLPSERYCELISGRANPAIVADLLPSLSPEASQELIARKEGLFRKLATHLAPPRGLVELLDLAQNRGFRLAVVTNAPKENAEHVLGHLGLRDRFELLIGSAEVRVAKPSPEPYLLALRSLNASASNSLAFEDSPSGVRSAVAAKLPVVGLLTGHSAAALREAGALVVCEDFDSTELRSLLPPA